MRPFDLAAHAVVLAAFLGFAGCGGLSAIGEPSPPSRFYLLSPTGDAAPATHGPSLGVGPIRIAEYLDRPQIVTRRGDHALDLAEFDRWGEPLVESVSRVLAANLGALLATDRVQRHPWRDSQSLEVQVELDVRRFDAPWAGPVQLEAYWRVRRGRVVVEQLSRLTEPLEGRGYDAMSAAMSRALHTLSKEIAAAISSASGG